MSSPSPLWWPKSANVTIRSPPHSPRTSWHLWPSPKQALFHPTGLSQCQQGAEDLEMELACRSKNNRQLAQAAIAVGRNLQLAEQWPHSWTELLLTLLVQSPSSFLQTDSQLCSKSLVLLAPGSAGWPWLCATNSDMPDLKMAMACGPSVIVRRPKLN